MAYVALYRAYRPQKFEDVVGQEHIIKTLQNAITLNKVAHAYLFCGPRGTGKTTLAKIMAKAMNCVHGPTKEPCGVCEICEGITKGTISDVIEIDAASNNGADDIRALRDTVKFLPAVGKYKVYIIDEVHMLSNAAFNALLKTLEEPPKHVIFILATTEPYKLPNTILSRCQRFDFQSISIDDILKRLRIVCEEENIKINDEALNQIATSAEGGMRDALSLLDQCISFSINEEISLDDVLAVSGNVSYLKIIELLEACISDTETDAIILLDKIIKEGKEVPRIINDIILFLRDVLLYKNNAIIDDKLMFKNDKFKKLTNKITKSIIYSWLDILNDASNQMRFSTQKRAYIELAILKMNDTKLNADSSFADRLESLENAVATIYSNQQANKIVQPIIEQKPVITESIQVNEVSNQDEVTIQDVENILNNASKTKKEELLQIWNKISEKYINVFSIQILVRGRIVAVSNDAFIVELQDVGFCNRLMQYDNYVKIIEIFDEFNLNIKDYICIPKAIWSKIVTDYRNKYSTENPKPKLAPINIGVKKRVIPSSTTSSEDGIANKVSEYFDNNTLKITEE